MTLNDSSNKILQILHKLILTPPNTRDAIKTFEYKTETFSFHSEMRLRASHNSTRPRLDQDVRFSVRDETKTLLGQDRNVFRDLVTSAGVYAS